MEIPTIQPDIQRLTGLHLWHAGLSNCSQRVRMVLTEKNLPWTSHLVDLARFEHSTSEYLKVNPKGLVPALIHDGRTIINSNDIIRYLEKSFPLPSMTSDSGFDEHASLFEISAAIQPCIRMLSHEFLFSETRRYSRETLDAFEKNHPDSEIADFLRRFSAGFSESTLTGCFRKIAAAASTLNLLLSQSPWLVGETFSLHDCCWAPNVHRLELFGMSLVPYPDVDRWFNNIKSRQSYSQALTAYENVPMVSDSELKRRKDFFENHQSY
jgi:glutathione S-transferase